MSTVVLDMSPWLSETWSRYVVQALFKAASLTSVPQCWDGITGVCCHMNCSHVFKCKAEPREWFLVTLLIRSKYIQQSVTIEE